MNYVFQDLNDITDSRELMDSRPHPFTIIYIYILVAIVLSVSVWAYVGEKEIVVKTSGVVRPSVEVKDISNKVSGKIDSINFRDGEKVKKDKVLYTIEHKEIDMQKDALEKQLKLEKDDIDGISTLKKSINDGTNYLDQNTQEEYYAEYQKYVSDCKNIKDSSSYAKVQIDNLQDTVDKLNLLIKSVNDNKNNFNDNSSYSNQYEDYEINVQQYQNKIAQAQQLSKSLKNQTGIEQSQIEQADSDIQNNRSQLEMYRNKFLEDAKHSLEENESKLKAVQVNPQSLNTSASQAASVDEYKNKTIMQLDENIKSLQEKVNEGSSNLKAINENIKNCTVRAEHDGIINSINNLGKGDFIQSGTTIASILPVKSSKYKIIMYIENKDIGNIKSGQEVNIKLSALPYSEYGIIKSKIESISADTKTSQSSKTSYYTAEILIPNRLLYSHKGEKAYIRSGMTCEGDIVTRKEKIIYYVLEKINLK